MGFMKKFFGGKDEEEAEVSEQDAWMVKGVKGRPGPLPYVDYLALEREDDEVKRAARHWAKYLVCYCAYMSDDHQEDKDCASYHLLAVLNMMAKAKDESKRLRITDFVLVNEKAEYMREIEKKMRRQLQ